MGHKVVELVVRIRDGCFQVPNRRFRTVLNVLNTTPEFPACGVAGGRGRPMMAQLKTGYPAVQWLYHTDTVPAAL